MLSSTPFQKLQGVGKQLINENDEADRNDAYSDYYGDDEEKYELTFLDSFGNGGESGPVSGYLSIVRDSSSPSILLEMGYNALHVEYESDNAEETPVEVSRTYQPVQCGVRYYVGSGKVVGVAPVNASMANATTAAPVQHNHAQTHGMVVMAEEQTVDPGSGCTVEEYQQTTHESDWCTYQCMQSFLVDSDSNGVVGLSPTKAFQNFDCICTPGKGMLVGDSSSHAQIAFSADAENMCTSEFSGGQHLVDFQASNPEHGGKMTMQTKMHSGALCTFEYRLVSGTVLSTEAPGYYTTTAATINEVTIAIVVSVVFVVLFVVPSLWNNKHGYTSAIYLMSRGEGGPAILPSTIYGKPGNAAESVIDTVL